MMNIDGVHRCWQSHFGDAWASVNALLRLSDKNHRPAKLSRWQSLDYGLAGWRDLEPMLSQIISVIKAPGTVEVVNDYPNVDLWKEDVWNHQYYPTKRRWYTGSRGYVCYQFDGQYNGHLNNPPQDDIHAFIRTFGPANAVQVGLPRSIEDIIGLLASSQAFFGIDSGMSHLAASVGVPMYLCDYQGDLDITHKAMRYTRCKNLAEAVEAFDKNVRLYR